MSDLIKREDAIRICKMFASAKYRVPYIEQAFENIPTIDAVSVVHGEWMPNPKIGWGETWVCSICGEKTTSSIVGKPRYNYCPMCGARMKGADDENV